MLRAERANVVLDIKPEDADFYHGKGYSIYDGNVLLMKSAPRTIGEYQVELKQANARIEVLEQQLAALRAELEAATKPKKNK